MAAPVKLEEDLDATHAAAGSRKISKRHSSMDLGGLDVMSVNSMEEANRRKLSKRRSTIGNLDMVL